MPTANKRISVSLTADDEAALGRVRKDPEVLLDLLDLPQVPPGEAALVHALMLLGIDQLREARLDRQYADLAASITPEEAHERRRVARNPRTAKRLAEDA
ncbi:MAG: hypothetical protein ACT4QF_06005 [Sporichthyaceae bacterium]